MPGRIADLYRHPVKGFTPERLDRALLEAGACFPCDRLYAVENGASGFDAAEPAHLPKSKFAVLAGIPALARARTAYDAATGFLTVTAEGRPPFAAFIGDEAGREAFAAWLEDFLDPEDRRGPLRVLQGPGAHRFMDDARAAVSMINLASVRDLEARLGRTIDPRRFRCNVHVEGWPAWAERDLEPGAEVRLGETTLRVIKPITRCAATHVDPATGVRDLDLAPALRQLYGHLQFGLYLQVVWGGQVVVGDAAGPGEAPILPPVGAPAEIRLA